MISVDIRGVSGRSGRILGDDSWEDEVSSSWDDEAPAESGRGIDGRTDSAGASSSRERLRSAGPVVGAAFSTRPIGLSPPHGPIVKLLGSPAPRGWAAPPTDRPEHSPTEPLRTSMIIVLKPHSGPEWIRHVIERIEAMGFTPHLSQGVARTIIGVIGDEDKLQAEPLQAIDGVEHVVPILKPFKLASREFHQDDTVIDIKGVRVGGGHLMMIAGAVRDRGRGGLKRDRRAGRDAGANVLRRRGVQAQDEPVQLPGAWRGWPQDAPRPRVSGSTCRWSPSGMDPPPRVRARSNGIRDYHPGRRPEHADFDLLKEVGKTRTPVLLKRGMSATVKDLLMSTSMCSRKAIAR